MCRSHPCCVAPPPRARIALAAVVAVAVAGAAGCRRGAPEGAASADEGGHALWFDGIDDHLVVGDVAGIDGEALTLEAWIAPERGRAERANVAARRDPGGAGDSFLFRVRWDRGGVLEFGLGNAGQEWGFSGSQPLAEERWTHVAVSHHRPSGRVRLYVDGALDTEKRAPVPGATGDLPLWIGGDPLHGATERAFAGGIDELRLWNVERDADALAVDAKRHVAADADGLLLAWSFDEGRGQQVAGAGRATARLGDTDGRDDADPRWGPGVVFD